MAMFRLFQVNRGQYLQLDRDVVPTARVSELCSAVEEKVRGEGVEGLVLLTVDGRLMESGKTIGAYPIGTENKPIFVFFQSYLTSPTPPQALSHIAPRQELEGEWQLLNQRPTPNHFQSQVVLGKNFAEHAWNLSSMCQDLQIEYDLQCKGWAAVLTNCNAIFRTYQKHQRLFCKSVDNFQLAKPQYLQLLKDFPSQVELLRSLPVPSTAAPGTSSLYDWISTHDERNSLLDLSTECQKALAQAEDKQVQQAITKSEQILASVDLSTLEKCGEELPRLRQLTEEAAELSQIQSSLSQNMQSTSQRAMRSGDAGTIADLVVSHQKSLQLMLKQNQQLETILREMENIKADLTLHIHRKLQQVTKVQQEISESNARLLFLHEHIKLAKKRFQILEQVCCTPVVLNSVVQEVERRRTFQRELDQKTQSLATELQRMYEEEKRERKTFASSYSHHFTLSLFPELQQRMPEFTCRMSPPHSFSRTSDLVDDAELIRFREKLSKQEFFSTLLPHPSVLDSDMTDSGAQMPFFQPGLQRKRHVSEPTVQVGELQKSKADEVLTGKQELHAASEQLAQLQRDSEQLKHQLMEVEEKLQQQQREREVLCNQNEEVVEEKEKEILQLRYTLSQADENSKREIEDWRKKLEVLRQDLQDSVCQLKEKEEELREKEGELDELQKQVLRAEANAMELVQQVKTKFTKKLEEKEEQICDLQATIKKTEEKAKQECQSLKSSVEELKSLKSTFQESEGKKEKQIEQLRGRLTQDEMRTKAVSEQLRQQLLQKEKAIERIQEEKESVTNSMREKLEELKKSSEVVAEERNRLQLECDSLRLQLLDGEQTRQRIQKESDEVRQEVAEARQKLAQVQRKSKEETEKLSLQLSEMEKVNQHLQKQSRKDVTEIKEEVREILKQADASKRETDELNSQCNKLRKTLEEKHQASKQIQSEMESKISELRQKLEHAEKEVKSAREEEETLRQQLVEKARAIEQLQKEQDDVQLQVRETEGKITELHEKLLQAEGAKDTDEHQVRQEFASKEDTIQHLQHKVREMEATITQLEKVHVGSDEKKMEEECADLRKTCARLSKETEEQQLELRREASRRQQAQAALNNLKAQVEQAKKKVQSGEEERARLQSELRKSSDEQVALQEEVMRLKDGSGGGSQGGALEKRVSELQLALAEAQTEFHAKREALEGERDDHMKRSMEMERELKQLQRAVPLSGATPDSPPRPPSQKASASASKSSLKVSITNLQVGDVALFMMDQYRNYLALAVDGRTYYLNQGSASVFAGDAASKAPATLQFKQKLLLGRITEKVFVEVRKESNRLRVPIGHRLYKIDAEEVAV